MPPKKKKYIYIYIYIEERERERERDYLSIHKERVSLLYAERERIFFCEEESVSLFST